MADNSNDEFYQYVGCYKNDGENRLLSDDLGERKEMSPLLCYGYCTFGERRGRFYYFGTQKGNRCYCGQVDNIKAEVQDPSKCNKKCKENKNEICGGKKDASVYTIKKLPMNISSTTMTATSVFPPATMAAASDLPSATMKATTVLPPAKKTAMSDLPSAKITTTLVLPPATMRATSVFPSAKITTTLKLPSITMTRTSKRDNQTETPKGTQVNPVKKGLLAGIGIGVVIIVCLLIVAICCFILWRRKLHRKQNRERLNTYRNAEDMSITSNQNVQIQGNLVSYTELKVYNHNHAYDELQIETKNMLNGKAELLDNSEGLSNDNYTVLVVPEDRNEGINSTLMETTTGFMDNISDNEALKQTNTAIGAYAILDPRETGFDRPTPEQKIKADNYAVLDPAETGFDRHKARNDEPTKSAKHEHSDKTIYEHAINNKETCDDRENQTGSTHSITMTNIIVSIENKATQEKTDIDVGAYAILDPDATGFDRTKPKPEVNDDSYTVLDPAETGFNRTKHRDDMPSQSVNIKHSGKAIHGHDIQNEITNGEGNHSLNKDGQYDLLNQVCRPQDDNEHTYSHSVDDVYDITNINRIPRTDDSSHAYDHL